MALTLGGEGACLLTRSGQIWHGREFGPVEVIDTVGVGDCFLAGLLTAVLLEKDLTKDLTLAQLEDAARPANPVTRPDQRQPVHDATQLRAADAGGGAG